MIIKTLEDLTTAKRDECSIQKNFSSHLLLLPGMLGPVHWLFPLVKFMRGSQKKFGVSAVPLGQTSASLKQVTAWAQNKILAGLRNGKKDPMEIILFGHSHGGRVACTLFHTLKDKLPQTKFRILTAGTPIMNKPDTITPLKTLVYNLLSPAYRQWPDIRQPIGSEKVLDYIGYYSLEDKVVTPEVAQTGHQGTLVRLESFSHVDMFSPEKMGPLLIKYLNKI